MKKYELTSELFSIGIFCTYWGKFSFIPGEEDPFFEEGEGEFCPELQAKAIVNIAREKIKPIVDAINSENEGLDLQIDVVKLYQPKYYNYGGDKLYIDVSLNYDKLMELLEYNASEVAEYLTGYKSGPGFYNQMPNTLDKLKCALECDTDRAIGAILSALFSDAFHEFEDDVFEAYCELDYFDFVK